MIRISNFTKKYKDKIAVDGLNLSVEGGSICGFIGHNGAGKTTTLKALVGIHDFDEGEIYVGGHSIKTQTLQAKRIMAYIPDNPDIYDFMTGIDYLNFISDAYQVKQKLRKSLIDKYAGLFEISGVLNDPISSYSHGMKQKLVIISALVHSPQVLILDEPFVGLDPKASHTLKELMKDICDKGGAILFSTHVLEVAQNLCDTIAIIKNGSLLTSGTTHEVLQDKSLESLFLELTD
ncbi:ABC transporter ATP-binding protein [Acidaminobacter sp. JC074]|uniref:ABC transporter ATP-binding protein n=1 Tax=Acidaminobacter sp. JC074 TaxID=2530199 RepID=UPI001F0FD035|nr:ABC transporter ATP-binding protein [Acidaminobacter sp. JC074]MCH4886675.1 ABC transporter ATP-binding protein [Acidaminobacter sp. JC074]